MGERLVAILPGDGIGPEVIAQAVRVLRAVARHCGLSLQLQEGLVGAAAIRATGHALPAETMQLTKGAAAVLLGPVAGRRWAQNEMATAPKIGLVKLRTWLNSFATLRPIRMFPHLEPASPLRQDLRQMDLLVVYDHSSGLFYGTPRGIVQRPDGPMATNTQVYTSQEIERTARVALEASRQRARRVVSVDMAKLLETGQLWRETVSRVALEFPDVETTNMDATHFFYDFMVNCEAFDVVLSEMSLGHLVASMATGLTGTFAIHPAAFVGNGVPMFQPSHGAALDLVDTHRADPIGAIRTVGLLLDHALGQHGAAQAIERAVESVLAQGLVPAEIRCAAGVRLDNHDASRDLHTAEIGDAVVAALAPALDGLLPQQRRS